MSEDGWSPQNSKSQGVPKPDQGYLDATDRALRLMRKTLQVHGLEYRQMVIILTAPGGQSDDGRNIVNHMLNYDPQNILAVLDTLKYAYKELRDTVTEVAANALAEALAEAAKALDDED
jgi:hypothetical protein